MWSGVGGFLGRLIGFFNIYLMSLTLLKMDLFSWIFFLNFFLTICGVMTWILLHMTVSCWLYMESTSCSTVVGFFHPMIRTHALVLFILVNTRLRGLLFVTGRQRTCCDVHSIGKQYQWVYLLMEKCLLPQIYYILWRGGSERLFLVLEG